MWLPFLLVIGKLLNSRLKEFQGQFTQIEIKLGKLTLNINYVLWVLEKAVAV